MAGWFPIFLPPIASGWNVLPLGCGGLVTGMFIANDGSMVCRTDVGNIYRWSGKTTDYANPNHKWVPLLNFTSLGASAKITQPMGGWEHVLAPNHSNVHLAIFGDIAAVSTKSWVYYSTDSGATWSQSNLSFSNSTTNSNGTTMKDAQQKLAVDPANPNIAYAGTMLGDGNSAGAYTTLNKAGGSSLATWTSVKSSGATPIPATSTCTYKPSANTTISAGVAIDASSGTTTIGGQIVTNRIIIPIAGSGIYESTDGGDTFTEIAATAMGTADFYVSGGGFTADGVYYCIVTNSTIGGIWRYASGTWTKIAGGAAGTYAASTFYQGNMFLLIDPRNNPTSKAYLSIFGPNGIGIGYTTTNANTGSPPTWTGSTSGYTGSLKSTTYDLGWINYIFGQGSNKFTFGVGAVIDLNGVCWWPGNQSLFYVGSSTSDPTPSGIISYTNSGFNLISWSMGRGMEVTVSQDSLVPPGGTYPILATQDLGTPQRGTFTSYPARQYIDFKEYTCENLDYAASDPSFVVARVTDQGAAFDDVSGYSTNYGADGSWTQFTGNPTSLWQAQITATVSNGSGGAGFILDVTAVASGTIFPYAQITGTSVGGGTYYGRVQPYGTNSTTGTGGTGTYYLDTSSLKASGTVYAVTPIQGGQTVAVDSDHMVTAPAGLNTITLGQWVIPAYTADRGATWALCSGLPEGGWVPRPWSFGPTPKPFAVGYGVDLNTVWACLQKSGTIYLYRSTDKGANFSQIASWAASSACEGVYCLSVPGRPGELWVTGSFTGGSNANLWIVTNANTASATVTSVTKPTSATLPRRFTLGAPATPGGYPTIYYYGRLAGDPNSPNYLYEGQWNGSAMTWGLFGPTGTIQDLPATCALAGVQSLRGDWSVYRRLYVSSGTAGFAYYNP